MICSVRRILATVSLLAVASSFFAAQTPPTKQIPPRPIGLAKWSPTPQELFVPYWSLEPGWTTELEMRNNLAQRDLSITPILRTTEGIEVPLQPVNLKPDEIVSVNLRDATASAIPELPIKTGTFGSVVFRFNGVTASNAFAAAVVRREGHPIDFHFDAYLTLGLHRTVFFLTSHNVPCQSS